MLSNEIAQKSGLHKSTVHRLLSALQNHRLIEKEARTGKYTLGLKLFELGVKAIPNVKLREHARTYLERLVFETGETAHLCVLVDHEILYLDRVELPRLSYRLECRRQKCCICSAAGKVTLAAAAGSRVGQ